MSGSEVRRAVAESLYQQGGAADASLRCDANSHYGSFDLLREILTETGMCAGQSVADIGCGSGQHLQAYARVVGETGRALGFDFSSSAVMVTRQRGLEAYVADGGRIPLADGGLDAITCNYAVYYMQDPASILEEWARLLKPGACLLISGPAIGTNEELYRFHQEVTGCGPSDADKIALGYVEHVMLPLVRRPMFLSIAIRNCRNEVKFPDCDSFLAYWSSTSLFLRSIAAKHHGDALAAGRQALKDHPPMVVTKLVSLLTARRSG